MTGRLILVRHGQTEANVAKRLDTALPGAKLTPQGLAQAEALGVGLAATPPLALVSSLALRARQTAGFVEQAAGVSLDVRDGLHEVQAGDLEDRTDEEAHRLFVETFHHWHTGNLGERIPGGETAYDVLERYVPVINSLREEFLGDPSGNGDIVVVSHGAAIRLVAAQLSGIPGLFAANNHLANTESVELIPRVDGGWDCLRWGTVNPPFEHRLIPGADDVMG
ncbi:histidine phosphatase family protein [Rhodococcus sp. IEGM 1379]|uniref:histidine phosphatase family protein n=1 Tax=Rhodococcus sp. IEGM 1379 TaxID=3047086 RepID=UPI0024B65360|nr:histidine phosphatase family protein [Rhodococcus sp. IEGM 1379]MDI9918604.1 histidine phosphatase family protein [Rhodococcus sp. IEGM 1379]